VAKPRKASSGRTGPQHHAPPAACDAVDRPAERPDTVEDEAPVTLDPMAWMLYIAAAPTSDAALARVHEAAAANVRFWS
jgi:hypothetical protein